MNINKTKVYIHSLMLKENGLVQVEGHGDHKFNQNSKNGY